MKIEKIWSKLNEGIVSWVNKVNLEEEIHECKVLKKSESPKEHVLYICNKSSLPKKSKNITVNILCIGDLAIDEDSYKNCNFINCKTDKKLAEIEKIVNGMIRDSIVLSNNMFALLNIATSSSSLQKITEEAAKVLENPILLVDSNYKILSSKIDNVSKTSKLNEQKNLDYVLDEHIAFIRKSRLFDKTRESKYPYYTKGSTEKEGWITSLVFVHGIEVAHVVVIESNKTLKDNDLEYVNFLCRIYSMELQKNSRFGEDESQKHSYFLSDLLDGHLKDVSVIKQRVKNLNWKTTPNMFVMTVSGVNAEIFDKKAQLISKQINNFFPYSRWIIHEGRIVFLLFLAGPTPEEITGRDEVEEYLRINNLNASVSRCFHSFLEVRKHFDETLIATEFGTKFKPKSHVHFYQDYVCQHIGRIVAEHYNLKDFYHPAVVEINEYDKKHKTNLLETLKEYIDHPDNPTIVSEHLFVHKNTLFYRMNKMKEIFGINLSDGEERLKIHITLKFMDLDSDL
ncbi:MAG: helix-turn-helix domain-containing protein [Parasporobacterium sp.]|nr:helix-turn-helix domain-containing protein [Parasporobacterium sp.]